MFVLKFIRDVIYSYMMLVGFLIMCLPGIFVSGVVAFSLYGAGFDPIMYMIGKSAFIFSAGYHFLFLPGYFFLMLRAARIEEFTLSKAIYLQKHVLLLFAAISCISLGPIGDLIAIALTLEK